jgi:hypothetical protein
MQAYFQGGGDLDHAGALVGSGLPGGVGDGQVTVAGDVAGAVRVSVGELDRVGVSGGDDDAAEVMHGVVEGEDGRLLATVRGTGCGEAAVDLVCELTLHPGAAERVDELFELAGDVAEAGRRAEDHRVGPEDVLGSGLGDVLRLGRVACPTRVGGNRLVGSELVNLAQPDFGPKGDWGVFMSTRESLEAANIGSEPVGIINASAEPGRRSFAKRIPIGVVGVITPWNSPFLLRTRAIAPALVAGNAVLLKPDPQTPVCGGAMFAQLLELAGLPEGLFHVLPGRDRDW